jgi:hypothetical protein
MKFSPKVLLFHIPWSYLKHRVRNLPRMSVDDIRRFVSAEASSIASR